MPKFPKPWFRKGRGWYLTLDRQQIPLGSEKKATFNQCHELMRQPRNRVAVNAQSVTALIDQIP